MRAYWWQGGVHFHPESDTDRKALVGLLEFLPRVERIEKLPLVPPARLDLDDDESVVRVDEGLEASSH